METEKTRERDYKNLVDDIFRKYSAIYQTISASESASFWLPHH